MKLHPSEEAFLQHLGDSVKRWVQAASEGVANPEDCWMRHPEAWAVLSSYLTTPEARAAFETAISDVLGGVVHTTLVAFNSGSALSDTADLTIHDQDGHEFVRHIHEFWPHFRDDAA